MKERRILKAIISVGAVTILAKSFLVVRDLIIAKYFGIDADIDAFFFASLVRMHIVNVLGGAIAIAFLPRLIKVRMRLSQAELQRIFSSLCSTLAFALVIVSLISVLALHLYTTMASGISSKLVVLFFIMFPALITSALSNVQIAMLAAYEKYTTPALISSISPIVSIFCLPLAPSMTKVYWLATSVSCGAILECMLLQLILKRNGLMVIRMQEFACRFRIPRRYKSILIGTAILTLVSIIPQGIAGFLGSGSIAILAYSQKIASVVSAIAGTAIATVSHTYFSQLASQKAWRSLNYTLMRFVTFYSLALVMACVILIYLNDSLVNMLFVHGSFSEQNASKLRPVQIASIIQIPFAALSIPLYRVLSTLNLSKPLWRIPLFGVLFMLIAIAPLTHTYGITGIALAITSYHIFSTTSYLFAIRRKLSLKDSSSQQLSEVERDSNLETSLNLS